MLPELAKDPAVTRIAPVANYELDLSDTVLYIGGTAVQGQGYDGSNIRVAVLDSGIDYTHAKMGGAGTLEAYAAAYGTSNADPLNTTRDGLFPTAKVVDGYDFLGEQVGLGAAVLMATSVDVSVEAFDFYFGGPGDVVDGLTMTPLGERYVADTSDIAGNDSGTADIFDFGTTPGNSEELGVMLITNGDRGAGNRGGATEKTEAVLIMAR